MYSEFFPLDMDFENLEDDLPLEYLEIRSLPSISTSKVAKNVSRENYAKEIVLAPFNFIKKNPGKNLRRIVGKMLNYWFRLEDEKLDEVLTTLMDLHHASLM